MSASSDTGQNDDPLFCRKLISAVGTHHISSCFSLMTYNILNQHCLDQGYTYAKPEVRERSLRLARIASEVVHYDPDIVCMQEIRPSAFDVINMKLSENGYSGIHAPRPNRQEGLATFYKPDRFRVVHHESHTLGVDGLVATGILPDDSTKSNLDEIGCRLGYEQNCLLVKFVDLLTENTINIGNVHTYWGNFKGFDVQCVQLMIAFHHLHRLSNQGKQPYIMVGDFNTSPTMPTYKWINEGQVTSDILDAIRNECGEGLEITKYVEPYMKHNLTLKSSYKTVMNKEPELTNCDDAWGDFYCEECLDYIFVSRDSFDVHSVLQTPDRASMTQENALPNSIFPSDHISIMAVLSVTAA